MKTRRSLIITYITTLILGLTCFMGPAFAESEPQLGDIPYVVYYSASGAESLPAPTTTNGSETLAIATVTDTTPYREGFAFAGWSWTDDNTPDFYSGNHITLTQRETTVYATWQSNAAVATTDADLIDPDDPGYMSASENTEPLGRSSSSQQGNHSLGLTASLIIALGALFATAAIAFGAYTLLDLKQTMDK